MKIVQIEVLIDAGHFSRSNEWKIIKGHIIQAIKSVEWPPGSGSFTLYDESGKERGRGSGVKPIKEACMDKLKSFGWQRINIGIPLYCKLNKNFPDSLYAIEITGSIQETTSLAASLMENQPSLEFKNEIVGETCIYNPDKWCYSHICFFREKPENLQNIGTMYEVLHVSIGE